MSIGIVFISALLVGLGKTKSSFTDNLHDRDVKEIANEMAKQVAFSPVFDSPFRATSYGNRRQLEVGLALVTLKQRPKSPCEADAIQT